MNDLSLNFLNNDVVSDKEIDELDGLFAQLLHVEPPTNMVERIMQAVSTLPRPKPLSQWNNYDFFMTESDMDLLS